MLNILLNQYQLLFYYPMKEGRENSKTKQATKSVGAKKLFVISKAVRFSQKQEKSFENEIKKKSIGQIDIDQDRINQLLQKLNIVDHKSNIPRQNKKKISKIEKLREKHLDFRQDLDDNTFNLNLSNQQTYFNQKHQILDKLQLQQQSNLQNTKPKQQSNEYLKKAQYQLTQTKYNYEKEMTSPQITIYDFNILEKIRHSKQKSKESGNKQDIKNCSKIHLSPIKRFEKQLTHYIQKQYLNIQKLRPITKKLDEQKQLTRTILQIEKKQISLNAKKQKFIDNLIKQDKYNKRNNLICESSLQKKGITNILQRNIKNDKITKKSYDKNKGKNFKIQQKSDTLSQFTFTKRNFSKKEYFVFGLYQRPPTENKIQIYRDFLWKINFSNNIFVEPEIQLDQNYKIYIGSGNNSMLIKGLIKRRFWWTIVDKPNQDTNFIWSQLKNNEFIKMQKSANKQRIKSVSSLTMNTTLETVLESQTQQKLSKIKKQKKQKKTKSEIAHKNFHEKIFLDGDLNLWNNYFEKNKKDEEILSQKIYSKRAILLKNKNAVKIQKAQTLKVHNHFNQNYFIGNKKALFYTMRKYYQLNNMNVFDYLPITFHISKGMDDPEYHKFENYYNQINQKKLKDKSIKNIWIVKPGEFTNRGSGITVCSTLDDIKVRIKGRQKNMNGKIRTFIVQKYIQKPLLYHKRKFDIRHYMMITCVNSQFKGYWYQQGYIRTASYQFNIKNCKDNLIHLTNDAIQKHNENYGKYQKGNKISYAQFQKYLDTHHKNQDFFNKILPKMKKICTQAIRASYSLLDNQRKTHNFQIFGMDFMIDDQFNPWLIEINTNPCLQLCCPLLMKIIPAFIENALKIGLDPLFQPPYSWPSSKKYQLGQNILESNKFSIIFDEASEGDKLQQLYGNIQKIDKNMGQIEQEDEQYQDEGKQWNQQV